jgi:hypothetical protein
LDGNDLLEAIVATGAQVLARCKSSRRPPVLALLPDGSYLTRIAGLRLRVIEARVQVTGSDGSLVTGLYRLVTTLLDHRTDPAGTLVRLYHERWEIETAYLALRHTLLGGRVLRSKDPAGIEQEMWALLVLYQAIRTVMVTAVETMPGTDPDRAGFTIAVQAARDSLTRATGILPATDARGKLDLTGHIGRAVLAGLLPPRRPRFSVRTVKCGISRYHSWNADDRPLTSATITAIDVTVRQPEPPKSSTRARPATPPTRQPTGRWMRIAALMTTAPDQQWQARDIARTLAITGEKALNSLRVQMSTWANRGLLTKTAPATYTLTETKPLTPDP